MAGGIDQQITSIARRASSTVEVAVAAGGGATETLASAVEVTTVVTGRTEINTRTVAE